MRCTNRRNAEPRIPSAPAASARIGLHRRADLQPATGSGDHSSRLSRADGSGRGRGRGRWRHRRNLVLAPGRGRLAPRTPSGAHGAQRRKSARAQPRAGRSARRVDPARGRRRAPRRRVRAHPRRSCPARAVRSHRGPANLAPAGRNARGGGGPRGRGGRPPGGQHTAASLQRLFAGRETTSRFRSSRPSCSSGARSSRR